MTSRRFVFTWNNYEECNFERICNLTKDEVNYCIVAKEVGESGTKHLQGYLEVKNPVRLTAIKKLLDIEKGIKSKIHVEVAIKRRDSSIDYCMKGEQSHDDWVTYKNDSIHYGRNAVFKVIEHIKYNEGKGKRTDFEELNDYIKDGHTLNEIKDKFPNLWFKYSVGIKAAFQLEEQVTFAAKLKSRFTDFKPLPWQEKLIKTVQYEPHPRKVIWYVDIKGGCGKSTLAKYIKAFHGGISLGNGPSRDIAHMYKGERVAIFDFTRDTEGRLNYGIIESIKTGTIISLKYDSVSKEYDTPHVIAFSNFYPDTTKLSKDRWDIRVLDEEDSAVSEEPLTCSPPLSPIISSPTPPSSLLQRLELPFRQLVADVTSHKHDDFNISDNFSKEIDTEIKPTSNLSHLFPCIDSPGLAFSLGGNTVYDPETL